MASTVKIDALPELLVEQPNVRHIQESYLRQVANGTPLTAHKKNKSAVQGSTAKIYRQKGTGRARQGERKNPHFRGGGLAFPPQARLQNKKMNKYVRRSALRSAVLWHIQNGSAWQINGSDFAGLAKTKQVAGVLEGVNDFGTICLVLSSGASIHRACRNLGRVRLVTPETLNVRDIIDSESIVFDSAALEQYRQILLQQNEPDDEDDGSAAPGGSDNSGEGAGATEPEVEE